MKVDRVLETSLYAPDLEAAEVFYTRVLGLEVHSREVGHHVFFRCGSGMLLVFNPDKTELASHQYHMMTKLKISLFYILRGLTASKYSSSTKY